MRAARVYSTFLKTKGGVNFRRSWADMGPDTRRESRERYSDHHERANRSHPETGAGPWETQERRRLCVRALLPRATPRRSAGKRPCTSSTRYKITSAPTDLVTACLAPFSRGWSHRRHFRELRHTATAGEKHRHPRRSAQRSAGRTVRLLGSEPTIPERRYAKRDSRWASGSFRFQIEGF